MTQGKSEFIDTFSKFYEKFFVSSAEAIEILADLQRDYPTEYESINQFSHDPNAIEELIEKLPQEKQAVLLKILLKAGKFGKDMANLFESSEEGKRKLAIELKTFASNLSEEMKKGVKEENERTHSQ